MDPPPSSEHTVPIAHSGGPGGTPQPLRDHLQEVAGMASSFAEKFESEDVAEWLGWWHDAGKIAEDCQDYLRAPEGRQRGPDHSSVGAVQASRLADPLAFNVAGHHGGLPDRIDLKRRLERKEAEPRIRRVLREARRFLEATPEPELSLVRSRFDRATDPEKAVAFWIRMLHSALVDADCLDTEAHFDPETSERRWGPVADVEDLWETLRDAQEELIASASGFVNEVRARIYRDCVSAAGDPRGVFSLTVPTGGGKTRSAMAFGLRHAVEHDLHRVIVVLPYTSIIEQNTEVYRSILGQDVVLEHHSNARSREEPGIESREEQWQRLVAENWDAPVVVTTSVQFFESLFSNQNSRVRKLHNIARSVVILDEVQVFPPGLLQETIWTLQHLVEEYGCSLVLCTATQPALARREAFPGFPAVREIVENPERHFKELRRVRYEPRLDDPWSWTEVAEALLTEDQALVVLNTVTDARALLEELSDVGSTLHLSTRLCPAHRREVMKEIRTRLQEGHPIHLVSTQVVEAGVDLDFPLVFRALGPLDGIIQAAGRCNREGHREEGRVVVFDPEDGGMPPDAYRTAADVTRSMYREEGGVDPHDPAVARRFFRLLYEARNLDQKKIEEDRRHLRFQEVGRKYRLIEEDSGSVLVPYGPGHGWIGKVEDALERGGLHGIPSINLLQPFLVSLRMDLIRTATDEGLARETLPGLWTWRGRYHNLTGLELSAPGPGARVA